jgi:pimeloyl-ACP methyl ester carboxylesterase
MPVTIGPAGPIHWIAAGEGAPLVLLHGLGGDVSFWASEIAALSADFRTIAIDLRGSGSTPPTPGGHTMTDLADDIAAVLDDLHLDRAHIAGFSMGGCVAQAFAIQYPDRVDRLILASTFAVMNPQARLFLDAVAATYARTASAKEMFDLICPWLFSIPFLADEQNAAYLRYDDNTIDFDEMASWNSLYAAQQQFDSRSTLNTITAPTAVIAGRHDSLVSLSDAEYLRDHLSDAHLTIIENAGHLTNLEQPAVFLDTIQSHLTT